MLNDRRTKATFDLFKELGCLRDGGGDGELRIGDVGRLDVDKMMARALDCLAAVCEAQRVRVAQKQPLKLREEGEALTPEEQAARNKVFRAALKAVAKGLTHDGDKVDDPGYFHNQLLHAFPDSNKLTDSRNWLPMHWAVVADEDSKSEVTKADVMAVYGTDPMALRQHHLVAINYTESIQCAFGYTPAHMLCGLEMTEKNMSLVRHFSTLDPRAFTMKAVDRATAAEHSFRALHIACKNTSRTEALLRLLVQLDASQLKSFTKRGGPLGLLCENADSFEEQQLGCLLEADSSIEVVIDGIAGCFNRSLTSKDRLQFLARLLEANPAAAQHKDHLGRNLAHRACDFGDRMTVTDCIEFLKLVLAQHKDALKEVDNEGKLPAHRAAYRCHELLMGFMLEMYPEASAVVDFYSHNLLHLVAASGKDGRKKAKARMLCGRYPAMMLQRDSDGRTPLLMSCYFGDGAMAQLLCEAGGREAASIAIVLPVGHYNSCRNGLLPLHRIIKYNANALERNPLSAAADAFRLLLRLYPEAAGTEGGVGGKKTTPYRLAVAYGLPTYYRRLLLRTASHLDPAELRRLNWAERRGLMYVAFVGVSKTPYRLAVECGLPAYYRRLLLRAAPNLNPAELRRLNWEERRLAMFVAFAAVAKSRLLLARLRVVNKDLVKHVVSFL